MIFKFTTERPSDITIWETVDKLYTTSAEDYTDFQIKFMMGTILCSTEFKQAKHLVNEYITQKAPLLRDITTLFATVVGDNWTHLKNTHIPPADLPSFVDSSLYTQYYTLMQLKVPSSSPLWLTLFDRQIMTDRESEYISTNYLSLNDSITIYKLWLSGENTSSIIVVGRYEDIFQIEMSEPSVFISSKDNLIKFLSRELMEYLDDHTIYDYSEKIIIPPFQLKAPHVSS